MQIVAKMVQFLCERVDIDNIVITTFELRFQAFNPFPAVFKRVLLMECQSCHFAVKD